MSSTALTERTATYRSADGLELFYRDFGDPAARGRTAPRRVLSVVSKMSAYGKPDAFIRPMKITT